MATAKEYFDKDLSRVLRVAKTDHVQTSEGGIQREVLVAMAMDFEACCKYGAVFLPDCEQTAQIAAHYLAHSEEILSVSDGVDVASGFVNTDEHVTMSDLNFTGRILLYTGALLSSKAKHDLSALARTRSLKLVIRDRIYVEERNRLEKPLAFISHDSRDKETFVRDLAATLQKMLCPVWYDEYSLIAGQSLRQSIESGLRECRKCVLVISENFLANSGWTRVEFDSVFTREILEGTNVIVPVWLGVTKEQVYGYSPRLLDKVGIPSSLGIEEVARRIIKSLSV